MATINVKRTVADPFYRYKMPRIVARVEGRGNGIKTLIANMSEVAKALGRPASYTTKYFGFELGTQTTIDARNDRYVVNGAHDANKLQDILDGFIRKFVLCESCENPETALKVQSNRIHSRCKACGHSFLIDPKLRLSSFIVRNPPAIDRTYEKEAKAAVKADGKNDVEKENEASLDESWDRCEDEDDDWADEEPTDTRLAAGIGRLVISADLEKSTDERLDMLHQCFLKAKEENKINDNTLLAEALRLNVKHKAALLLVNVFLDEKILEEQQLTTMRNVLIRFTMNDQKAQRYLLGGIEQLIINNEAILLPKAAHILRDLYEKDIVDEEAILAWAAKPSSSYVSKTDSARIIAACERVLQQLREEETEETEEEEIDFQKTSKKSEMKEKMEAARNAADLKVVGDDGEELSVADI